VQQNYTGVENQITMEGLHWVVVNVCICIGILVIITLYQNRHLRNYETFVALLSSDSVDGFIERGELDAFRKALNHCKKEAAFGRVQSHNNGRQYYSLISHSCSSQCSGSTSSNQVDK
jgi:hypothetical protein